MKTKATIPALVILLAGCATAVPVIHTNAVFDIQEARAYLSPGPNSVSGNAMIRQHGGGVVHCGGSEVYLIPATDYAAERMMAIYGTTDVGYRPLRGYHGLQFFPEVPEYTEILKATLCDSSGNFEFENVADGEFYVMTTVSWRVNDLRQGGFLMRHVTLVGGEDQRVILAP